MNIKHLMNDLEEVSESYASKFDIERTPDWFIMKLTEEVGELMQSHLKYIGQARTQDEPPQTLKANFEDELTDVIGMALLIAKNQNVDLEEAFERKWLKYLESPQSIR